MSGLAEIVVLFGEDIKKELADRMQVNSLSFYLPILF
jgi:hypothetical protein